MHTFKVEKDKVLVGYYDEKTWGDAQRLAASERGGNWMDYHATALTQKQKDALGIGVQEYSATTEEE